MEQDKEIKLREYESKNNGESYYDINDHFFNDDITDNDRHQCTPRIGFEDFIFRHYK